MVDQDFRVLHWFFCWLFWSLWGFYNPKLTTENCWTAEGLIQCCTRNCRTRICTLWWNGLFIALVSLEYSNGNVDLCRNTHRTRLVGIVAIDFLCSEDLATNHCLPISHCQSCVVIYLQWDLARDTTRSLRWNGKCVVVAIDPIIF